MPRAYGAWKNEEVVEMRIDWVAKGTAPRLKEDEDTLKELSMYTYKLAATE